MPKKELTARDVAKALVRSNNLVGRSYGAMREERPETPEERVDNLLNEQHAYVRLGDPHEWGGPHAVATIYLESSSHRDDDCICPHYYEAPCIDSMSAPPGYYIECINAAVASVYPS